MQSLCDPVYGYGRFGAKSSKKVRSFIFDGGKRGACPQICLVLVPLSHYIVRTFGFFENNALVS